MAKVDPNLQHDIRSWKMLAAQTAEFNSAADQSAAAAMARHADRGVRQAVEQSNRKP